MKRPGFSRRRSAPAFLRILFITLTLSGCEIDDRNPELTDLERRLSRVVDVPMEVDASRLPPSDREMLKTLVESGKLIHEAYLEQFMPGGRALRDSLAGLQDDVSRKLHTLVVRNGGPFDKMDHFHDFVGGRRKNPGSGFYPPDLSKEEIEIYLASRPDEKPAFLSPYTVILRNAQGLAAVPYHERYAEWVRPAAELLRKAGALATNPSLRTYFELRADALLTDEYIKSDIAWMNLKHSEYDVIIGPDEVYDDALMGIKASYEVMVGIRDGEGSEQLEHFARSLDDLEQSLPHDSKYKRPVKGLLSPMVVVRDIYRGGDMATGYQAAAANLPNDLRALSAKGTKKIFWKNILDARLEHIILPLGRELIASPQVGSITSQGLFNVVLLHELCHALGPRYVQTQGDSVTVNQALKEQYTAIEEAKADVAGLHSLTVFMQNGTIPERTARDHYVSYLASMLRAVRFGTHEAHGRAALCELNYLRARGGLSMDPSTRKWSVDVNRIGAAVSAMARELLTIQATGDYDQASDFLVRWGSMPADLERSLAGVSHLPVDINPVYHVRWE